MLFSINLEIYFLNFPQSSVVRSILARSLNGMQDDRLKTENNTPPRLIPPKKWGQYYENPSQGCINALMLNRAAIGHIPYDKTVPVFTAWDLGFNDSTCIWFFQLVGKEIHLIDYVEGSGESLAHWLGVVKSKPYTYEKHLALHDVMAHEFSSGMIVKDLDCILWEKKVLPLNRWINFTKKQWAFKIMVDFLTVPINILFLGSN